MFMVSYVYDEFQMQKSSVADDEDHQMYLQDY